MKSFAGQRNCVRKNAKSIHLAHSNEPTMIKGDRNTKSGSFKKITVKKGLGPYEGKAIRLI